ncbi:hypothetical protein HDU96_008421 [Phlyctochytrium bullatum]|nr:hypothetical protein HDU96_008421 [Phlyctochytrium bullatum]
MSMEHFDVAAVTVFVLAMFLELHTAGLASYAQGGWAGVLQQAYTSTVVVVITQIAVFVLLLRMGNRFARPGAIVGLYVSMFLGSIVWNAMFGFIAVAAQREELEPDDKGKSSSGAGLPAPAVAEQTERTKGRLCGGFTLIQLLARSALSALVAFAMTMTSIVAVQVAMSYTGVFLSVSIFLLLMQTALSKLAMRVFFEYGWRERFCTIALFQFPLKVTSFPFGPYLMSHLQFLRVHRPLDLGNGMDAALLWPNLFIQTLIDHILPRLFELGTKVNWDDFRKDLAIATISRKILPKPQDICDEDQPELEEQEVTGAGTPYLSKLKPSLAQSSSKSNPLRRLFHNFRMHARMLRELPAAGLSFANNRNDFAIIAYSTTLATFSSLLLNVKASVLKPIQLVELKGDGVRSEELTWNTSARIIGTTLAMDFLVEVLFVVAESWYGLPVGVGQELNMLDLVMGDSNPATHVPHSSDCPNNVDAVPVYKPPNRARTIIKTAWKLARLQAKLITYSVVCTLPTFLLVWVLVWIIHWITENNPWSEEKFDEASVSVTVLAMFTEFHMIALISYPQIVIDHALPRLFQLGSQVDWKTLGEDLKRASTIRSKVEPQLEDVSDEDKTVREEKECEKESDSAGTPNPSNRKSTLTKGPQKGRSNAVLKLFYNFREHARMLRESPDAGLSFANVRNDLAIVAYSTTLAGFPSLLLNVRSSILKPIQLVELRSEGMPASEEIAWSFSARIIGVSLAMDVLVEVLFVVAEIWYGLPIGVGQDIRMLDLGVLVSRQVMNMLQAHAGIHYFLGWA